MYLYYWFLISFIILTIVHCTVGKLFYYVICVLHQVVNTVYTRVVPCCSVTGALMYLVPSGKAICTRPYLVIKAPCHTSGEARKGAPP